MVVANLVDNSEEDGRSELEPGHLYFGITFGGLAWMGGEGAEGGGLGGGGEIGEEGGGRGDGKQRREERREKATKREIDLAFHSYFK
jgi:hypothetical protein